MQLIFMEILEKISVQNSRKSGTPGKIEWKGGENNEKDKCSLHDNRDCNADGPFFGMCTKENRDFNRICRSNLSSAVDSNRASVSLQLGFPIKNKSRMIW